MSTKIITPDTRGGIEGNESLAIDNSSEASVSQAFDRIVAQLQGSSWEASREDVSGVPCAVLVRRIRRSVEAASEPSETAPVPPSASVVAAVVYIVPGDPEPEIDPSLLADRPAYFVENPIGYSTVSVTDFEMRDGKKLEFCRLTWENDFTPKYPMGDQTGGGVNPVGVNPEPSVPTVLSSNTPRFGDLASVKAMGTGETGFVVGFDTEFSYPMPGIRVIDSYQFSVLDPFAPDFRYEIVLLPLEGDGALRIEAVLAVVVRVAGLWKAAGLDDPRGFRRSSFWISAGRKAYAKSVERLYSLGKVKLVLAGHFLPADLSAFARSSDRFTDPMRRVTSAAGGLVSLQPIRFIARPGARGSNERWLPLSVSVRDTMTQTAPGSKSLAALGKACGVPKLDVGDSISDMTAMRRDRLVEFLDYGVNDATIVLEYLSALWGDSTVPPITLSGGGARALREGAKRYWWGHTDVPNALFTSRFQGLMRVGRGVEPSDDKLSYYAVRRLTPVDGDSNQVLTAYKTAFHGGWNGCASVGHFPVQTFDWDLMSAYPTAMAAIADPAFEGGCIEEVIKDRLLSESDFPLGYATPLVAFVSFDFPATVSFPCLPAKIEQSVVYLSSSEGLGAGADPDLLRAGVERFEGAWCCAPELLLALKLGARVRVQIGYRLRVLEHEGAPSMALRFAVKQLVEDRDFAKRTWGKKSLEEQTIKVATNSAYGKAAQNVTERNGWNAFEESMESVGGSAITSPYYAATITSLVRAILLAIANEVPAGAFLSVTTDGFISTESDVERYECYGLAEVFREARSALVGDPRVWEIKHKQSDLTNLTTRGNCSLQLGGVLAKAGLKSPEEFRVRAGDDAVTKEEKELAERRWFLSTAVSREGKVTNRYSRPPSFRELSRSEDRLIFEFLDCAPDVSLDFDLKRQPVHSTLRRDEVLGFELAGFETAPWRDAHEYGRGRQIARHIAEVKPGTTGDNRPSGCLRTVAEWEIYFRRYASCVGRRIRTADSALLTEIVAAYKGRLVSIPALDSLRSVKEKLAWLSSLGLGDFSLSQWNHMSESRRCSAVLRDCEMDKLSEFLEGVSTEALGSDFDG